MPWEPFSFFLPAVGPHMRLWQTHERTWWWWNAGETLVLDSVDGTHHQCSHKEIPHLPRGAVSSSIKSNCYGPFHPWGGWRRVRSPAVGRDCLQVLLLTGKGMGRPQHRRQSASLLIPPCPRAPPSGSSALGCLHLNNSRLGNSKNWELTKAYV